ncbi:unnamed protein product [Closterium sp. NIES-53]
MITLVTAHLLLPADWNLSRPSRTAESTTRSEWLTRDPAARLVVRNHLPLAERAHFGQHKTAKALYDAVVARYSSPATAALGRLILPYLFPELSAFATIEDLITHLRTSDTRYRAALPSKFLDKNPPLIYITLYFIVIRLPDSFCAVRDHFLALDPTDLAVDLLEKHLLAAETSVVAIDSLTERSERKSCPALLVRAVHTGCRVPRPHPPPVPGTLIMALRPSSVPLRVPLLSPHASSLADGPDRESDLVRAASPTVSRLLATVVTDPSFVSADASALVTELEEFECLATAVPHLGAMLLAHGGDPDAPDILTLRFYEEAITGPYSSQWQTPYVSTHGHVPAAILHPRVLQRFSFRYSSPQSTRLPTGHSLSAPSSDESVEPSGPYPELVGYLMYLMTCTRPDLAYPLSILARYVALGRHRPEVACPGRRRRWLPGTSPWLRLWAMAAQELRWLTYLLTDLGEWPRSSPVLYVDNKALTALC